MYIIHLFFSLIVFFLKYFLKYFSFDIQCFINKNKSSSYFSKVKFALFNSNHIMVILFKKTVDF